MFFLTNLFRIATSYFTVDRCSHTSKVGRHGVDSIPELLFLNGIDKIGSEVCYKKIKSTNYIIKYFFHDNPTSNINYSE